MVKKQKPDDEADHIEVEEVEAVEADSSLLDLPRNTEAMVELEEALAAAMTNIVSAAQMRDRVGRLGARRYNPKPKERMLVITMIWAGLPLSDIAKSIGMNIDTLRNHFAVEIEEARKGLVVVATNVLIQRMRAGDIQAIDRILRLHGGSVWREAISPSKGVPDAQVTVNVGEVAGAGQQRSPEEIGKALDAVADRVIAKLEGKG